MATTMRNELFGDVLSALIGRGGAKRGASGWWTVRCPFHNDHNPSAGYNAGTGSFRCHSARCGRKANARELAMLFGLAVTNAPGNAKRWQYDGNYSQKQNNVQSEREVAITAGVEYERLERVYNQLPSIADDAHGMKHARLRGLRLDIGKYGVRCGDGDAIPRGSLVFPYFDEDGRIVGIKYRLPPEARSVLRYCSVKGSTFSVPFGMQTLRQWRGGLLVVEGEINALSCFQELEAIAQEQGVWRWVDVVSTGSEMPGAVLMKHLARIVGKRQCVVWCDSGKVQIPGVCVVTSPMDGNTKLDANEMLRRGILEAHIRAMVFGRFVKKGWGA